MPLDIVPDIVYIDGMEFTTTGRQTMAPQTMTTYTKLRNGTWGIRGDADTVKVARVVNVHKRSGETKLETVDRIVWTDGTTAIAAIKPAAATPKAHRPRHHWHDGFCDECDQWAKAGTPCYPC